MTPIVTSYTVRKTDLFHNFFGDRRGSPQQAEYEASSPQRAERKMPQALGLTEITVTRRIRLIVRWLESGHGAEISTLSIAWLSNGSNPSELRRDMEALVAHGICQIQENGRKKLWSLKPFDAWPASHKEQFAQACVSKAVFPNVHTFMNNPL